MNLFFKTIYCTLNTTYSYEKENIKILNYINNKNNNLNIRTIKTNLVNKYLNHYYNLLGSGFKNLSSKKKNNINYKNKNISQNILRNISRRSYKLLDWQLDFKSNYRWNEKKLSKKIRFLNIPNTDVKIPWEFARMQHAPQLAIYAGKIKKKNFKEAKKIFQEFENQLIDFIASNPPEYGVNWICTMDVSIRISNLLVAKDIFNSNEFFFSKKVDDIFANSVNDHKKFILKNLEYSSYRNNHYLSNISGLAIIARYLPQNNFSDSLIAFVTQELNKEIFFQFNKDGASIEGSTCYHKFSMEMILYATATVLSFSQDRLRSIKNTMSSSLIKTNFTSPKLDKNQYFLYKISGKLFNSDFVSPFSEKYFYRILKIYNFFSNTFTNDNQIIQIGDNDSGKFLNFSPVFYKKKINNYYKKNLIENRECVGYILEIARGWGLIPESRNNKDVSYENYYIKLLLGKIKFKKKIIFPNKKNNDNIIRLSYKKKFNDLKNNILKNKNLFETKYSFSLKSKYIKNLNFLSFKDFGMYIWKNQNIFFSLRVVKKYDKKFTSHCHFDQISNILFVKKKCLISDPGTYNYSGNTILRNLFRSYQAHFTPINNSINPKKEIFSKIDYPYPKIYLLNRYCYIVKVDVEKYSYYSCFIYKNNRINIYHINNKTKRKPEPFRYNSLGYGILNLNKTF